MRALNKIINAGTLPLILVIILQGAGRTDTLIYTASLLRQYSYAFYGSEGVYEAASNLPYQESKSLNTKKVKLGFITSQDSNSKHTNVEVLISSLSSEDEDVSIKARRELIAIARNSQRQRNEVVQGLLHSVEEHPGLERQCSVTATTLSYWKNVTMIFAELGAREAIDVTIRNLACENGYSGSLAEQPSKDALIRMGIMAIPKLSQALQHEPDAYKRVQIAICLGDIGGAKARLALRRALRKESSEAVILTIKRALSSTAVSR